MLEQLNRVSPGSNAIASSCEADGALTIVAGCGIM